MTAQLTRTLPRTPGPARSRPQLSPVQITASALAAVSAAVVSSFFGVAGTVIGAAVASVISTITAAVYSESLRRTNDRLRTALRGGGSTDRTATLVLGADRPTTTLRGQAPTTRATIRVPAAPPSAAAGRAAGGRSVPARLDPRRGRSGRRRWTVVALSSVAVFVAAMAVITVVEFLGQRPVSALVGGSSSTGTTIGDLATTSTGHGAGAPTPSVPSGTAGSSAPASSAPASTGGAASSSAAPTATQVSPSSASASPAPSTASAPATSAAPTGSPAPTTAGSSPSTPATTGAPVTGPAATGAAPIGVTP